MKSNRNIPRILLDTSFLLPTFGISVTDEVTEALSSLDHEQQSVFYSNPSMLETTWFAIRQMKKHKFKEEIFRRGMLSITKTGVYQVLHASAEDYLFALQLYQKGHTDMIDNLLYAISLSNNCAFLTIDNQFKMFVDDAGLQDIIVTPSDIA
ncbi:MAG: PIN domain-containing protein [Candidatus Thorarchaeota archaeon]